MVRSLTDSQKSRLRNRRSLAAATRANIDYKMAKKLQSGLNNLEGLLYIMEKLPEKNLKRYLNDNHVQLLFEITEAILKILEYKKVRGTPDNLYLCKERLKKEVVGINLRDGTAIKMGDIYTEKAGKKDINRAIRVREHIYFLNQYFNPEIDIKHPGLISRFSYEDLIDWQRRQNEDVLERKEESN